MAARGAVAVRRRRSLTGIDSRDVAGGKGLAQPIAPYAPQPRVRAAIRDVFQELLSRPPTSSLPRLHRKT